MRSFVLGVFAGAAGASFALGAYEVAAFLALAATMVALVTEPDERRADARRRAGR